MKKICLWIVCLIAILHASAFAYDCTDGQVITGVNNKQYCQSSPFLQNWYTAFVWCEAHHMQLATMHEICDIDEDHQWDGNTGNGKCLNANNTFLWGYSASPAPADVGNGNLQAYTINGQRVGLNMILNTLRAICKMF